MPDFVLSMKPARGIMLSTFLAVAAATGLVHTAGPLFVAPAAAEAASGLAAISREELAKAEANVAPALQAGHHVLFVELYGTTLYVFDATHPVGGPVVRVLEVLGFESILPDSVAVGGSGASTVTIDILREADVEHVFLLNFSTTEDQVREVEAQLREIADGRLYRLDTTTGEASSDRWTERQVLPRIASAIAAGAD